jgi:hypothetical protein
MKILAIHGYFKLPDDFEGGFNEAIEEIVKYRRNKQLPNYKNISNGEPNSVVQNNDGEIKNLWVGFLDLLKRDPNKSLLMDVFLGDRDDIDEWIETCK